jgi:Methyltransferase domain
MAGEHSRTAQPREAEGGLPKGDWAPCRLCGARADFWNRKRLLNRYDIDYYLCSGCGSLSTEEPYWLEEAYDVSGIGDDVGAAQRTIDLALKTSALLDQIGLPARTECIDFGGGIGLFTRLMRDRGFNFFSYDRYAKPFFSDRYNVTTLAGRSPAVVTAFEVLEHFPDPHQDLEQLFEGRPALVVVTTELFTGQDVNWYYLSDTTGQHVFFYSPRAINLIAKRFDYSLALVGGLFVFVNRQGIRRLGINADRAFATLKALSQNNMLMRRALALFVNHQRSPYDHIQRDVEATQAASEPT